MHEIFKHRNIDERDDINILAHETCLPQQVIQPFYDNENMTNKQAVLYDCFKKKKINSLKNVCNNQTKKAIQNERALSKRQNNCDFP